MKLNRTKLLQLLVDDEIENNEAISDAHEYAKLK
jgi:hypothetical protein